MKKLLIVLCGVVLILIAAGLVFANATSQTSVENVKLTYGKGASYTVSGYMSDATMSGGGMGFNTMSAVQKYDAAPMAAEEEIAEAGYDAGTVENSTDTSVLTAGKKLKKTYNYTVETTEYDDYKKEIADKVSSLGGYMEQQEEYVNHHQNKSMSETYSVREINYTIRVPSKKISELLSVVSAADVISSNEYVEDVTTQYIDLETHIAALRKEYKILEELLSKAVSVTETIEVQNRLSDINYEISSYEKSMEALSKDIDYSKLFLRVDEVVYYQDTVVRFSSDITRRWYAAFEEYVSYTLPYIVLFIITLLPVVIILGFLAIFFSRIIAKNRSSFQQTVILKREREENNI